MSDRFATQISIGGKIPRKVAEELCGVISSEGLSLGWDGEPFEPKKPEDLVEADKDTGLTLYDVERAWGSFDDLEEFLVEHGIAFDRSHEPKYEYDGELVMFRPGMRVAEVFTADTSGKILVRAEELQNVIKLLRAKGRVPGKAVEAAREQLAGLTGAGIPGLEDVKIVG